MKPIILRVTPGARKPVGAWHLAGTTLMADAELPVLKRLPRATLEPHAADLWGRLGADYGEDSGPDEDVQDGSPDGAVKGPNDGVEDGPDDGLGNGPRDGVGDDFEQSVGHAADNEPNGAAADRQLAAAGRVTFDATGWIGGEERPVKCAATSDKYVLTVSDWATFETSRGDGATIVRLVSDPPDGPLDDLVISAPLVIALALTDVFVLHASSVLLDGRALVFVGVSEAGKSTLAAHLDGEADFKRLTDDLTPVSAQSCLPHYPQPRLAPSEHAPTDLAEIPLAAVLLIGDVPAATLAESERTATTVTAPSIKPLTAPEATLSLVRHSVGARLFDTDVAARHLAFAAALTTRGAEVAELAYPRDLRRLPEVAEFLRQRFGTRAHTRRGTHATTSSASE